MKLISITVFLVFISIFLLIPMLTKELKSDFLNDEFKSIENYIIYRDSLNDNVSKAPVSWHLDHALITINQIYKVMDTSNVENYRNRFSFGRTMMFTFNKIPRGKAKSPNQVKPKEVIDKDSIYLHLEQAKLSIKQLCSLPRKAHFKHPYIGMLKRKQAKKFLKIHTNHHLAIIRDILKKS